jgi:hypothetical protein
MTRVSTLTWAFASSWPATLVRWMSVSPAAHRPSTYHAVSAPVPVSPCASTCSQVLSGVRAFHDAISWVASKPW